MTTAMLKKTTTTKPKVYVVQETRYNVAAAEQFGELHLVLTEQEEVTLFNVQRLTTKIRHQLRWMTSQDYLVLVGNPVAIGLTMAIAAELTGGKFFVLKWDGQETRYLKLQVDLNQRGE